MKDVEIDDVLGPNIVPDVFVNVSEVSDICNFLLFSPLFVDGFRQFLKGFLKVLEVLIVAGKHVTKVPFALAGVPVKIIPIHVLGTLLGWGLC